MRAPPALAQPEERKTSILAFTDDKADAGRDWILLQHLAEVRFYLLGYLRRRDLCQWLLLCLTTAFDSPGAGLATPESFASWLCPKVQSGLTVRVDGSIGDCRSSRESSLHLLNLVPAERCCGTGTGRAQTLLLEWPACPGPERG